MGRQSSRIWWQNKDHKEMVTWDGTNYQYHDKAYIWDGNAFELVWEKLKYGQQANSIEALKFATTMDPRESTRYFFGFDPEITNKLIRVRKGSYTKSDLLTTERTHFAGSTRDGKLLLLKEYVNNRSLFDSGLLYDIDNGSPMVATDVDYLNHDPVSLVSNISFSNYLAASGGNYRNIATRGSQSGVYYAMVVSAFSGQRAISIFYVPIPMDPSGNPYSIIGMKDFYHCRAVGWNANSQPHLADIEIIGAGQAIKVDEIDISNMISDIGIVYTVTGGGIDRETYPGYICIKGTLGEVVIDWLNVNRVAHILNADFLSDTGESRLYDVSGCAEKYAGQLGEKDYQTIKGIGVYDSIQVYVNVDGSTWKQLKFDDFDIYSGSPTGAGLKNLSGYSFKVANTNAIFVNRSYVESGQSYNYWQGFEF